MYYLYVLKSEKKLWHHIGYTHDLKNRLSKHNAGEVRSTRAYRPLNVIYIEEFKDKSDARRRELFLKKTARARNDIFEKFNDALIV